MCRIQEILGLVPRRPPKPLRVYVACRPFTSFGGNLMQKLPRGAKSRLVDFGVCHYMVVFEDPASGQLQMFDFGPLGGDVSVGTPWQSFQERGQKSGKHRKGCVQGEVRHTQVRCELFPFTSVFRGRAVGDFIRTGLTKAKLCSWMLYQRHACWLGRQTCNYKILHCTTKVTTPCMSLTPMTAATTSTMWSN
jgi:hypothetical protein